MLALPGRSPLPRISELWLVSSFRQRSYTKATVGSADRAAREPARIEGIRHMVSAAFGIMYLP